MSIIAERRIERSDFLRGNAVSDSNPIFVIGCGRSGTTLIRAMLERHPRLWGGPESWLWIHSPDPALLAFKFAMKYDEVKSMLNEARTAVAFADSCFGECARRAGKARWVEKTPRHVHVLPYLMQSYPRAVFIHMVRDGRDVACSLRNHPKARLTPKGPVPIKVENPIRNCIDRWVKDTSAGLAYCGHPRLLTIRYERLVNNTEPTLRSICEFIGEEYCPELLTSPSEQLARNSLAAPSNLASFEPVNPSSMGRWRRDLNPEELEVCLRRGGPLLQALGYWDGMSRF